MTRLVALVALIVSVSACASPTPPAPTTFSVSGRVLAASGAPVVGNVRIMDGIHAGQARTMDATGQYSFTNLAPSAFTLQAGGVGVFSQNKAVNLTTANQSVDFNLTRIPVPD